MPIMAKRLQLTFDDGPEPVASLNTILNELKVRKVSAAFFLLGKEANLNPSALNSIIQAGHTLGNHSWDHLEPHTERFTDVQIQTQFRDTHNKVLDLTNVQMNHWRAPRGEQLDRLKNLLTDTGNLYTFSHCDWHADSRDCQGAKSAAEMLKFIRENIALHPTRPMIRLLFHITANTAAALKQVLDGLISDGHMLENFSQTSFAPEMKLNSDNISKE
jgi:peptidoglycan/xylan/chitin deacetylase (PgdA/CDA1 family)